MNKTSNVYARVATGFRAPAIQGRLLLGDTLSVARSETVTSYEAGYKADLMNRRARVAFNVFSYEIKDQQLTAVGGAANFNQLVNACGSGCTVLDPITAPVNPVIGKFAPTVSTNGNSLPQAPETMLSFTARYSMPLAGGEMFVLTDWRYRSEINFFLYDSVEFKGKPLTEGGLRVGYSFGKGKYEAAAFVRNLTNQFRVVGGIDFNNLTGFINEPRSIGASFKASF